MPLNLVDLDVIYQEYSKLDLTSVTFERYQNKINFWYIYECENPNDIPFGF